MKSPIATLREWANRFGTHFKEHTGAWILFFMLLFTISKCQGDLDDIHKLCALTGDHVGYSDHPYSSRDVIDNICLEHFPDND